MRSLCGASREPRQQAVRLGVAQLLLEPAVELVEGVAAAQADDPVGLRHQRLQQLGELLVAAGAVAEDDPQRQPVEKALEVAPVQRAAQPQRVDLLGGHLREALAEGVHALGGGEDRLGELAPVAPLLAVRERQGVGLEVLHALALGAGARVVGVRRLLEQLPDGVGPPQHHDPAPEQLHALPGVLALDLVQRLHGAAVGVHRGQQLRDLGPGREQPARDRGEEPEEYDPQALLQRRLRKRAHALIASAALRTPSKVLPTLPLLLSTRFQGRNALGIPSRAGVSSGWWRRITSRILVWLTQSMPVWV